MAARETLNLEIQVQILAGPWIFPPHLFSFLPLLSLNFNLFHNTLYFGFWPSGTGGFFWILYSSPTFLHSLSLSFSSGAEDCLIRTITVAESVKVTGYSYCKMFQLYILLLSCFQPSIGRSTSWITEMTDREVSLPTDSCNRLSGIRLTLCLLDRFNPCTHYQTHHWSTIVRRQSCLSTFK